MPKSKKYYVVWKGRKPGIYKTWTECKAQTDGHSGARFRSFSDKSEAEKAFKKAPKRKRVRRNAQVKDNTSPPIFAHPKTDVVIYCDGACPENPGEAGCGLSIFYGDRLSAAWYGLYHTDGTNNTAELHGFHQALLMAKEYIAKGLSCTVCPDSMYALNAITKWAFKWEVNGWITSSKKKVVNREQIEQALDVYRPLRERIAFAHCPGHAGIMGNELADRMALLAIDAKEKDLARYPLPDDAKALIALPDDRLHL